MSELSDKHQHLQELLHTLAPLAVAFSGGVDSSLLLKVAHDTLDEQCIAVTIDAPYLFRQELSDARQFSEQLAVQHLIIPFDTATLPSSTPLWASLLNNPPDRCYLCKKAMLNLCKTILATDTLPLIDGSTLDDQQVHRPGRQALQEQGIRSPLAEVGFSKQDVRSLSRELGLKTWDKPAQSCLLTRFPHNQLITPEALRQVEVSEQALRGLGLQVVRVRSLGDTARIEVEDREQAYAMFPEIEGICRQAGFTQVTVDPAGYRCGSMDQN